MHDITSSPAVVATDLVKTYPVKRGVPPLRALDDLTLEIAPGEIFGLLGPNGAGKSTTVKILSTLTRADSGCAAVAGHDVQREPDAVRHAIGLVSQKSSSAPMMTGRESLVMTGRIHGLRRADARDRADELLGRFGLADAADRLTKTYSGGMNRKLDVAIGLVNRPAVLFLDEPTTGLDPEARAELWSEIERLASEDGTTVLLTTHYLDEADHLTDRLAIVDRGRIVAAGSPDELKRELRGDRVVIEVADAAAGARAAEQLSRLVTLVDLSHEGRAVRARTDEGASVIPLALASLEQAGIEVASATVSRPSLDDVYLRHAGRTFEEVAR
ncbi:MAG: ATP-binding cassette domain-containing protein [Intrasporangium sp.]|uniref:ATP-binding cassette domain-containing protein n=1 Tax=Intrasporangium sp. TaxID=1925024 RepID=UPI00264750B7|nr:ATP-binding cassette domain-containing protein [Intrasporangium sp.]MDN5796352.1 ATP-binding cassette domain-containing protein [Intrasporangium sp.]